MRRKTRKSPVFVRWLVRRNRGFPSGSRSFRGHSEKFRRHLAVRSFIRSFGSASLPASRPFASRAGGSAARSSSAPVQQEKMARFLALFLTAAYECGLHMPGTWERMRGADASECPYTLRRFASAFLRSDREKFRINALNAARISVNFTEI